MNKKELAGRKIKEYVYDGMILGLGTGSTAYYAIEAVGDLVRQGMHVQAVATSKATEQHAAQLGIPLLSIDEVSQIDLAVDGVDEIDRSFNAIKGGGGALFREKVVASIAKEVIWVMDESKLVESIGTFPLPIEIAPFGYLQTIKRLEQFNFYPILRLWEKEPFLTDNGNYIVDLHLGAPIDITHVRTSLSSVVGVLEDGLFLQMCKRILVGHECDVEVLECSR